MSDDQGSEGSSSTKIVIIVLVAVGVLFVIFVVRGAVRKDNDSDPDKVAKEGKPGWSKTIKGLFGSLQPKIKLKQDKFSGHFEETIPADPKKKPFRTITFIWRSGQSLIVYTDPVPQEKKFERLQRQPCPLQNPDGDDKTRCSIAVLKDGGTITFDCVPANSACSAELEK
ncbi:MAG TPA: hypothetical protein VIF64_04940 [Pyrinomonadaceae bacterium]|jgi:hypothetical protein